MWTGASSPMAASAGPTPGRSSPTTGSGEAGVTRRLGGGPAARRARDERMASAPAMTVTDRSPAAMSRRRPADQPLGGIAADGGDLARPPGPTPETPGQFRGRRRARSGS